MGKNEGINKNGVFQMSCTNVLTDLNSQKNVVCLVVGPRKLMEFGNLRSQDHWVQWQSHPHGHPRDHSQHVDEPFFSLSRVFGRQLTAAEQVQLHSDHRKEGRKSQGE
jgi:hypothetical protein